MQSTHEITHSAHKAPRILWLTEELYPPQIGGVELMVARLSAELARTGLDVRVITRQTQPPSAPEERIGSVSIRRLAPGGVLKGRGWRAAPPLLAFFARLSFALVRDARRYDVLIVSGMKTIPLVAVPLGRVLGKPSIVRVESTNELDEPGFGEQPGRRRGPLGRLANRFFERLQRAALIRADSVIALSGALEKRLLQKGVQASRICQIPNAIDLRSFSPATALEREALREQLSLPRGATLMIYVGRLSRAKGVDLLVRMWPRISARHPDLHLLIAGEGRDSHDDCEAEMREQLRSGLPGHERVRMLGPIDRVHLYLKASDLYILPSHFEGFSIAIIEALASGLPALLTPVGSVPELIRDGENGFIFAAQDGDALAAAVDVAVAARERWPEIGRRARATVETMDLAAVGEQYRSLLDALLERRSRAAQSMGRSDPKAVRH
ncbi:MAG TPA: glycosyltransferase family 4 protein [Steroidobacteraceae bacterium]|nr:glycosyltransferase family 4 protein [Steroidobacteraceae bacterium]